MAKKFGVVLIIVIVILIGLGLAKNIIAKAALSSGVKAMTGLKLQIKGMKVGLVTTLIDIKELKLFNPPGFSDKVMANVPEIYVDYDLGAFFKKKVHLESLKLNLQELVVVKNEKGQLNLDSLKVVKEGKEKKEAEKKEAPQIQIDDLYLKIGKVVYKDYTKTPTEVKEYNVNIDERRKNITDLKALTNWILFTALVKTPISKLADFNINQLKEQASQILLDKSKTIMEKTKEKLKNILPFGK